MSEALVRSRRPLKVAVQVAVSATLLALILLKLPWAKLWGEVRALDAATWLAVWAAFLAGHALGVFKWRIVVNLGRARLGKLDAAQCYGLGMFSNLCLPSIVGGDALKALMAGRITGRYEAAVIGGLAERLIDTAVLLVLILIGAGLCREAMPEWGRPVVVVGLLVAAVAVTVCLPLAFRVRLERWPRRLRRIAGRSLVALRRLWRRPSRFFLVCALSLAIQSWFVVLNAWLGRGIGIEAPLAVWFFAVPMAKAITLAPISFGGFGVREAALAGLLSELAGVPPEQGVAASLLWQTVIVATGFFGGALWFALGLRPEAKTGAGRGPILAAEPQAGPRHG